MSGRKNVLSKAQVCASLQMAESPVTDPTNIQYLDNVGYQFLVTGVPTGTFGVQVSIDYQETAEGVIVNEGHWSPLPLNPIPSTTAGVPAVFYVDISGTSAPWIQGYFTSTATGAQTIACAADVSGNLAGQYFVLGDASSPQKTFVVWFKVSGVGTQPTVAGATAYSEVDFSNNASANTIGGLIATAVAALNSTNSFTASNASGTVTITNKVAGPFVPAFGPITGFTFTPTTGSGTLIAYITGKQI